MDTAAKDQSAEPVSRTRFLFTALVRLLLICVIWAGLLFGISGEWGWLAAWLFIALYFITSLVTQLLISPELRAERATALQSQTRSWDKVIAALAFIGQFGTLIVAALDRRLVWAPWPSSIVWPLIGLVLVEAGLLVGIWAMLANQYFSSAVRIQEDRGQQVTTTGPYRFVRHPGYVGFLIVALATPVALTSLCAFGPALLLVGTMVGRTALEDRTLIAELEGYQEYARQTRYRLIPGIW